MGDTPWVFPRLIIKYYWNYNVKNKKRTFYTDSSPLAPKFPAAGAAGPYGLERQMREATF
jgi:hypothetical protein